MPTGPGWDRRGDPFGEGAGPFVAAGPHGRAVDAVLSALESGERLLHLAGASGVGKTRVAEAIARAWREPGRRVARLDAGTGVSVPLELVRLMSGGATRGMSAGDGWARFAEIARLARAQQQRWLLVVDHVEVLEPSGERERLGRIDARNGSALAILTVGNDRDREANATWDDRAATVRLPALTRSEAAFYLAAKLTAGGWPADRIATGAVARLHAASRGVPRALDRLTRRVLAGSGTCVVSAADVDGMLETGVAAGV